jgi:transposase
MARSGPLLTETQWKKIAPLLPKPPKQRQGGRPWIENRLVLEGILWILRSGARWQDMPERFPHPSTCWRQLRDWEEQGVWLKIWRTFLSELNERQQWKRSESFLDGSFAPAKKGALESEQPSGQGNEVDGGRRPRSSSEKLPSLCIPGGSPARGNDARGHPCRPHPSCQATAPEGGTRTKPTTAIPCGIVCKVWNRVDLSAQEESRARRLSAAALPASLDRGVH